MDSHQDAMPASAERSPAEQALPARRPTHVRYWVLAWLCAAAVIAYVHRNVLSVMEDEVRYDLGLTKNDMGLVFSALFLGYALFQIPSGWAGDRWGARRPLVLFAAAWSLATAMLAMAGGYSTLLAVWCACGVAQAGLFPCAARSITQWLPATGRAFASGALGGAMSVGAAASVFLAGLLLEAGFDWRVIVTGFALMGWIWAWGFLRWYRERPEMHPGVNHAELALIGTGESAISEAAGPHSPTPWGAIVSTPALWFICGQQFFRAAGYVFYVTWFPTYLKETRGVSTGLAGALASLPLLAIVVGSPLAGALSDWLLARTGSRRISRQWFAVASMLACAALIVPANWIANPLLAVSLIAASSFCAAFGGPVSYTVTMDLGGRHVATVFGMMNMSGNFGAAVFPFVAARLSTATGNWDAVLFVFAGVYVLAACCWMLVDPDSKIRLATA
ncbi:MAG: MFS transporter [Pirellulales bacterium]